MRRLCLVALAAIGGLGCAENATHLVAVDAHVVRTDDDSFEKSLETWGSWSNDETYGTVWTPSRADFVPYATDGHFADVGGEMVWLSDLPWGETLHRGWWVRSQDRWRWVPGRVRSGAVVRWAHEGDRTAWAPAAPPGMPEAPLVGERPDDELAITVLGAPNEAGDEPDATQDDEQRRAYSRLATDVQAAGYDAADELMSDDGF